MGFQIWWQIKVGNSSFWFDNWTKQEAVYYMDNDQNIEKEIEVKQCIIDNTWNELKLKENISEEMVKYIVNNISPLTMVDGKHIR